MIHLPDSNEIKQIPGFSTLDKKLSDEIRRYCQVLRLLPGELIFADHTACHHFILILEGTAIVQKITEDGHHLNLHHLHPGETCGLTASCLLGHGHQPASLIAETDLAALLLSHPGFETLMQHSRDFATFVHLAIERDLEKIIHLVEDVTSLPIEQRLAKSLLAIQKQETDTRHTPNPCIHTTHQHLSEELGSAREVISRVLKRFEQQGWVKLHRGSIEILNRTALNRLSRPKSE